MHRVIGESCCNSGDGWQFTRLVHSYAHERGDSKYALIWQLSHDVTLMIWLKTSDFQVTRTVAIQETKSKPFQAQDSFGLRLLPNSYRSDSLGKSLESVDVLSNLYHSRIFRFCLYLLEHEFDLEYNYPWSIFWPLTSTVNTITNYIEHKLTSDIFSLFRSLSRVIWQVSM